MKTHPDGGNRAGALIAVACLFMARGCALGQTVIVSPEAARDDPDFRVQGEYAGDVAGAPMALQVAARGNGRFDALLYRGGLPGDGWDGAAPVSMAARREDGGIRFEHGDVRADEDGAAFRVRLGAGGGTGFLKRVHRASPHAGAKPPDGAAILFDGTSSDAFRDGARVTEDGLLMEGALTRAEFEDLILHVEFRLAFMPEASGQRRSNSGVYIQQRYEVQILDSFAEPPTPAGAAALYRERPPDLNMSYPPLSWQTYRIHFTAPRFGADGNKTANARFIVYHNGVRVHDDVEQPHGTGAGRKRGEGGPGPVLFQNHRDPVRFRNIWAVVPDPQGTD